MLHFLKDNDYFSGWFFLFFLRKSVKWPLKPLLKVTMQEEEQHINIIYSILHTIVEKSLNVPVTKTSKKGIIKYLINRTFSFTLDENIKCSSVMWMKAKIYTYHVSFTLISYFYVLRLQIESFHFIFPFVNLVVTTETLGRYFSSVLRTSILFVLYKSIKLPHSLQSLVECKNSRRIVFLLYSYPEIIRIKEFLIYSKVFKHVRLGKS